jgi:hypothetical protein
MLSSMLSSDNAEYRQIDGGGENEKEKYFLLF